MFLKFDKQQKGLLTETECSDLVERLLATDPGIDTRSVSVKRFVQVLDADGSRRIRLAEVLCFYEVLNALLFEQTHRSQTSREAEEPSCREALRAFFCHMYYDSVVNLICILNIFSFMARDLLDLYGETLTSVRWWLASQLLINFIFAIEIALQAYSCGLSWMYRKRMLVASLEVFILILTLAAVGDQRSAADRSKALMS